MSEHKPMATYSSAVAARPMFLERRPTLTAAPDTRRISALAALYSLAAMATLAVAVPIIF